MIFSSPPQFGQCAMADRQPLAPHSGRQGHPHARLGRDDHDVGRHGRLRDQWLRAWPGDCSDVHCGVALAYGCAEPWANLILRGQGRPCSGKQRPLRGASAFAGIDAPTALRASPCLPASRWGRSTVVSRRAFIFRADETFRKSANKGSQRCRRCRPSSRPQGLRWKENSRCTEGSSCCPAINS